MTTNPSHGNRSDSTVEDVPMSLDTSTTTSRVENISSPPLSPTLRPIESIVPPNSPDPLWRCCARLSKMDLDDVDESNDQNRQSTSTGGAGLTRADLSFLQAHNPLASGNDTTPRRVSDDFASNENSNSIINAPPPSPQLQQQQQQQDNQQSPASSCRGSTNKRNNSTRHGGWETGWDHFVVRDIPLIYFIEPSTSLLLHVSVHPPELVVKRITECLRCTSVQARYFPDPAAAALLTLEHVEMYLVLWLNKSNQLLVELQRRRGDSCVFARYCRLILNAAKGDFNAALQEERVRKASLNSEWQESLQCAERVLEHATTTRAASLDKNEWERHEAVVGMVSDLISKDDSDARHRGMETACILTDPRRTGIATAVMMSRMVVLGILPGDECAKLGGACKQIHLTLLMLIMARSFPGQNTDTTNNTNNSSTNSSSTNMFLSDDLEMDDDNECFFSDDEHPTEQSEFTSLMFHQALQVLANSLEVLANFEHLEPERTTSPERFLQELVESFVGHADRLVPENGNLVRTLLEECHMVEQQPHNAYLAAKILKYLCSASPSVVTAVLEEHGLEYLTHAHQVGQKTHLCLDLETEQLLALLLPHVTK